MMIADYLPVEQFKNRFAKKSGHGAKDSFIGKFHGTLNQSRFNKSYRQNMKQTISDTDILNKISDDDSFDSGFRLLVKEFQEPLYWHIRRLVHRHEDADDVLQNTFLKVVKSIHGFNRQSKLYTWLYRIATNETLDFLKKNKSKLKVFVGEDRMSAMAKEDPYFDPDEVQLRLIKAIETLPEKQRVVFNLRYYDDMSYKEMSDVTDTSIGALKASYHHAVKKIEKYIKESTL